MKCPNCGLENPPTAERCDCGYDFPSRSMKSSYLTPASRVASQSSNVPTRVDNGKARIQSLGSTYQVVCPSRKSWPILLFAIPWLGGWVFGAINAIQVLSGAFANPFMLFWLAGWTVGGVFVVIGVLWGLFGTEKLEISLSETRLSQTVFGIGRKRAFPTREISNLRFREVDTSLFSRRDRWSVWGFGRGKIEFDHGLKSHSFGLGLDDPEALYVIDQLKKNGLR